MSACTSLFLICFYFSFSFQLGISAFDNVDFRVKRETPDQCSASLQSKDLEIQRLSSALQTNKQQLDELQSQLNDLESTMSQIGNQPARKPVVCPTLSPVIEDGKLLKCENEKRTFKSAFKNALSETFDNIGSLGRTKINYFDFCFQCLNSIQVQRKLILCRKLKN